MIAATLHGPSYGALNHDEHSIEVFDHIGDVVDALFERMNSNGQYPCTVATLDGRTEEVLFSTFGESTSFTCYAMGADSLMTDFPEANEGIVMEALAAVHGGHWEYDAILVRTDEGLVTVQVEKAGMS